MSATVINEKVEAGAVFTGQKIKPKWFIWNKRKIDIEETTYTWRSNDGSAELLHFSVRTNNGNYYELSYNKKTLQWVLEKTEVE